MKPNFHFCQAQPKSQCNHKKKENFKNEDNLKIVVNITY